MHGAAGLVALALLLVIALAGCGGRRQPQPSVAAPHRVVHPAPRPSRLLPVEVTVLDGDTGKAIPHPLVSAVGAVRRHGILFVAPRTRSLTVTSRAPDYPARTVRLQLGARRRLTVSLYRSDGQWLMYGASPARTQTQDAIRIRPPFRVVWSRYLGTLLEFPAVVDDGVAYLSNLHGLLFALSMRSGRTLWQLDMHTVEEDSSPAVVGPELVAHVKAGRVLVIDRASGRVRWSYRTSGEVESSPVVEQGIDYLGDWAGDVYALDLRTHKPRWVYHDGCKITASATIAGGVIYLGDYCGRVLALERSNGRLLWSRSAGGVVYGTSATAGGRLFVPSRASESLVAFKTNGNYLWRVQAGGLVYSAPAVWRGRVVLRLLHGRVVLRVGGHGHRPLDAERRGRDLRLADGDRRRRLRRHVRPPHRRCERPHRPRPLLVPPRRVRRRFREPRPAAALRLGEHLGGRAPPLSRDFSDGARRLRERDGVAGEAEGERRLPEPRR